MMRYLGAMGAAAAALALLAGCSDDPLRPAGEGGAAPDDAARARAYAESYCDYLAICGDYSFGTTTEGGPLEPSRTEPIPAAEIESCKRNQARVTEELLTCGEPRLAEYDALERCTDIYTRKECRDDEELEACAEALNAGEPCRFLEERRSACGVLATWRSRCDG